MNKIALYIVNFLFGCFLTVSLLFTVGKSFLPLPEKGSFEAAQLCNQLFNNPEISGVEVKKWISKPLLDNFENEIYFPDAQKTQANTKRRIEETKFSSGAGAGRADE